jgi:hypothetical protein
VTIPPNSRICTEPSRACRNPFQQSHGRATWLSVLLAQYLSFMKSVEQILEPIAESLIRHHRLRPDDDWDAISTELVQYL